MPRVIRLAILALWLIAGANSLAQVNGPEVLSAGKNYREIPQQPLADPSRIEVIDFFFYGCPFCNELRPALEAWRKSLPDDVILRRTPAVRRDSWVPLARTFYTLEALGETERLHDEVYRGYHDQELHMSQSDVMADWASRHGIDRQQWLEVYHSDDVTRKVELARKMTSDYRIEGTPSLVVNGRYLTSSGMTDDVKLVVTVVKSLLEMVRSQR